jgi:hypothetical protein
MRNYFLKLSFLVLTACSVSAYAEVLSNETIPEKITEHLAQKHPKATDITVEKTTHFGQEVYEVHFKEADNNALDIYRSNGNFHVAGIKIAPDDLMFASSKERLKTIFPDYSVKQAIMIVNPNGAGEEYDIIVESSGKQWDVNIDKQGNVEKKELN